MKRFLFIIAFSYLLVNANAQQWVEFTQQNQYKLFLNTAYTGSNNQLYTTISHRNQYTFLTKRAIASQFLEFSMPIIKKNYGIGLKVVNDFIGYQRYTLAEITGAYHLNIKKSKLSFGLGLGLVNLSLNGQELRAAGGTYENELIIHNDEILPNINVGGLSPTFSFGILYSIDKLDLGIAIQNINSPKLFLNKNNVETKIIIGRTINLHSTYVIELSKINIKPMLSINTDLIKHQMQFGINAEINNIYFGLAFRGYFGTNNDAIMAVLGTRINNKIRIGYSYDYNISYLNKSNFGSHEISISYFIKRKFSTKNKGNVLYNPRFL